MKTLYTTLQRRPLLAVPALWVVLLAATVPLMQRIPNGADHYFMIDVGETQIVLNNWGTLHATGYPHYTLIGNLFTDVLTAFGMEPLVAAAWFSMVCGLLAAALVYWLLAHVTQRPLISLGITLAYCFTRSVYIHFVIAEIYTFGLAMLAGLLLLALWQGPIPGRIYWLVLLGGIGVAHHRAIAMVAPALLVAVWPELTQNPRRLPRIVGTSLLLGLAGFVPYAYMLVRARQGAAWVYGEPDTLPGLWDQFIGREASRFIGLPETFGGLADNLNLINGVLALDVTAPGMVIGVVGLLWAAWDGTHRRAAVTMLISGGVAYTFHAAYYTDVLSALILPVTLSIVFGWAFVLDGIVRRSGWAWHAMPLPAIFLMCGVLLWRNVPFIHAQVTDTRGLEAIAVAEGAPDGSTLMMPWGPLHFAVGYARDIAGALPHITLVDHTADYTQAFADGVLIVPEYLQYSPTYNPAWWDETLSAPIHPRTVAPGLVVLLPERELSTPPDELAADHTLDCTTDTLTLTVTWTAPGEPLRDMTAFMHLLDENGALIAQDDHPPASGWYPVSAWQPGELVREVHTVPRMAEGQTLRYGLYYQDESGAFINEFEREIVVACDG
ncbi:MAG: hypothetical protein AAF787_24480 [Chloroflexota bacterium]